MKCPDVAPALAAVETSDREMPKGASSRAAETYTFVHAARKYEIGRRLFFPLAIRVWALHFINMPVKEKLSILKDFSSRQKS